MTPTATHPAAITTPSLSRIHWLLGVQTLVVILVSINRLTSLTLGYVASNEFLRWVDFNNMLVLPLISAVAFYLLKKQMEYASPAFNSRWHLAVNLIFIVGLYLLAASYGDHEVTNYLHARFCMTDTTSDLCRIIIYNDDEFSHYVFFTGFVMMNIAILLIQVLFPHKGSVGAADITLLVLNSLFIGAGIFANLAFEEIGLDLYVVALLAIFSVGLWWRRGLQPMTIYYTIAYVLGLLGTFIYKTMG